MKKFSLLFLIAVLISGIASAQVTVSIPEVILPSEGGNVTVPINVTDFNNIGAITLKIKYDPAVLTFQGTPNPLGGSFSINAVNGNVLIAWANLTALNTGNGKLLDLNFSHISGNSNLEFIIQSCEI
ncbi:MAG: cohesin domain-containing protein, partial [Ignavibacteriaceae bacterium]